MATPVETILSNIILPFEKPHDYQVEDINASVVSDSYGWWLDLGLGKTFCSICTGVHMLDQEGFDVCIVMCPETLIQQWVSTVNEMDLVVAAYRGTPAKRKKIDLDVDFLVMSYQIFQRDYDRLKDLNAYFIVDEATILCNSQNLLWKMLQGGSVTKKKAVEGTIKPEIIKTVYNQINRGCCLLSATPINKPTDAYGLIKILSPEVYRNYSQFERIHVDERDYFDQPKSYKNLDLLHDNLLLNATMRSTADHIKLPPIIFKTIKYELAADHLKLYDQLLEEKMLEEDGTILIDALSANSLYHWAQRLIFNPDLAGYKKVPVGIEIVDGLVKSAKKFIMCNNYKPTNRMFMERYKIGGCYSEVSSKEKRRYIQEFKDGILDGMTVNTKSGGVGLDLPMCQQVIAPEIPITPRDFFQFIGRCHRQGQKQTVVVTTLVALGTIQETLFKRIQEKDDLMKQVIDTPRSLTEDLNKNVIKKSKQEILNDLRGGRL